MRIKELQNVAKKNHPLHYRKSYTGDARIEFLDTITNPKKIEFVIEHLPHGETLVSVTILDNIEYPLIPVIQSLKEYIKKMYYKGDLP